MQDQIKGIIPPMITSFTPEGEIYEKGIKNVARFLMEKGVQGLFLLGSFGSFALMSSEERRKVAGMVLDEVKDRIPVIVHIGAPSTREAVALARHAQDLGAAAVASVVPFYYAGMGYREREILGYFAELVQAVRLPVYFYNFPKTTNYHLTPDLLLKLVHLGVKGLKDSSGDLLLFGEFMNAVRRVTGDFNFMMGLAGLFQPAYMLGARACVAGAANGFPELLVEVYEALETKKYERASELQVRVSELVKLQGVSGFGPAGCYSILKMRGLDPGTVRKPWREPDKEESARMKAGLTQLGLL